MEQDARLSGLKPEFAKLTAHICANIAEDRGKAIPKHMVLGELVVHPEAGIPPHPSLPVGARFPAFLYHSGLFSNDEAAVDTRRCVLRVFEQDSRSSCAWISGASAQLQQDTKETAQTPPVKKVFGTCKELEETVRGMMPNWDLIMLTSSTGTFPFGGNAQDFAMIQRLRATPPKLEAFLQARPHLRQAAWGALDSAPASYTDLCYSTSVASLFQSSPSEDHSPTAASERLCQAEDCESGMTAPATLAGSSEHQGYYARYRLVSEAVLESGNLRRFGVAPKEVVGFPETFPREAEDARPQDYLGKELLARVLADGGHKYILQVQLHAKPHFAAEDDRVIDATLAWDTVTCPWRSLAVLYLFAALTDPDEEARNAFALGAAFNPSNAPPGLGIPLATASNQAASLSQLRLLVYSYNHCVKTGKPLPEPLQDLMAKHGPLKPDGKDSRAPQIGPLPERTFSASPLPLGDSASTLSKATVAANGQLRVPGGRSATQARVGPDAPFLRRRVWDADTRVAVIGAGIGGLAAAMHLKRLGYRHVEVLEKDAAVGGMCRGVEVGGRWYDLGGQFLARGASPTVTRLAAELGADWEELGDVFGGVVELETGGGVRAFEAPLRQAVKARQVLRFLNEATKTGHEASSPLASFMSVPEAARSISDFLSSLNIAPEEVEVALRVFTASGYGFPGQTPAVYFHQFLQIFLGEPPRLKSGYQNLMELMAANLRSVRCGVRVQEVVRRPGSAPKVVFEGGWEEEFDKVIVTGGAWLAAGLPQGCIAWNPTERALMEQPQHRRFCTTLATVAGWKSHYPPGVYVIGRHCADPCTVGHCVAFQRCHSGADVFLFWAYARADASAGDVTDLLRDDVAKMGGVLGHVHVQRSWGYAHQLSPEDLAAGKWIHQFDSEMQGKDSVFYLGGVLSFESTECNAAAAESLVTRHFSAAPQTPPPRSSPDTSLDPQYEGDRMAAKHGSEVAAKSTLLFDPVEEGEIRRRERVAANAPALFPTIDEHLRHQARARAAKVAYVHVDAKCHVAAALTFAQLDAAAESFAGRLKQGGASAGDRVILMYPPDRPLDFLQAFFGCVRAQMIPVPLAPVNPGGSKAQVKEGRAKLALVARDCGARVLLTTGKVLLANRVQAVGKLFEKRSEPTAELNWVATDKWAPVSAWSGGDLGAETGSRDKRPAEDLSFPSSSSSAYGQTGGKKQQTTEIGQATEVKKTGAGLEADPGAAKRKATGKGAAGPSGESANAPGEDLGVCFLMYTSGSTGDPKGVMVGHANLMHNLGVINAVWSESTRCISWLPLWHDMGLIASALCPVVSGAAVFISPLSFIQNPVLWLEACSKFRATLTQAPAFALDLVARKFGAFKGTLDLS